MVTSTSDGSSQPSTGLQKHSLSEDWERIRDAGLTPRVVSDNQAGPLEREALSEGFRLMGHDALGYEAHPQQLRIVECIASGKRNAVVLVPRQSAKTTTIMAWLLGMCALKPGLQVALSSGETGKAVRLWFTLYVLDVIDAQFPDKSARTFKVVREHGGERIEWDNGSRFLVAGTEADLRGKTWDILWLDEAQGLADVRARRWFGTALPTQSTRAGKVLDMPLVILSGTAGKQRTGNAMWDALEAGRNGDPDTAILEYSAGIDLTIEDTETWEQAEPLLLDSHPGIQPGNLTPLALLRADFSRMSRPQFMAEYLSIFEDEGATSALILPPKWSAAALTDDLPPVPEFAGLALAVNFLESSASVCAAWRDDDGIAHVMVVNWQEGTRWLPEWVREFTTKRPKASFVYDDNRAAMRVEVANIERGTPRPRLTPYKTPQATDAAALFMRELNSGNLHHYGQAQLDAAAAVARRREIGKGFGFGLPDEGGDVSPLEAAALALRAYDAQPNRSRRGLRFVAA